MGTFMQWPSWYAAGWVLMYAVISHWMVITEEEHLQAIFGEEYAAYQKAVPRYIVPTRQAQ
jgi:protein-S-isoprenylcysteine O-methyltransferase Ste14